MSNHNWCFVIRTTYLAGYQGTTINGFCFMTILWHNKILKTEIKILRIFVIIKHWENSCFTIFYDIDPRFVDDFTILMTFVYKGFKHQRSVACGLTRILQCIYGQPSLSYIYVVQSALVIIYWITKTRVLMSNVSDSERSM